VGFDVLWPWLLLLAEIVARFRFTDDAKEEQKKRQE
jgi:hypothetical protein